MNVTIHGTKIVQVKNKIPDFSDLVTTAFLETKIGEVENKISDYTKSITTPEFNKLEYCLATH